MKNGNMTGAHACAQARPARIMGSMRARTVSAGVRGVLRRHVVRSAALAAAQSERSQRHATAHPKSRKVCAGSSCRRDTIDSNEFGAVNTVQECSQQCASTTGHQAAPFFPVCEQARCAKGDAVSPSPIVRTTIIKHKAAIAASSVDFDGAAAATTSVSSEGTAGTKAWMSGAFVHICRDFDAWPCSFSTLVQSDVVGR